MTDAVSGVRGLVGERPTMFGHPRGLVILFFAEMWERFSYYGMRAILVFYLTWHFLYERDFALTLYGAYVALVYLGPLLGGYLADRFIGFRKAVIFGAVLLTAGHGLMGLHGAPASERLTVGDQTYAFERIVYSEDGQGRRILVDGESYAVDSFVQPERGSTIREVAFVDGAGMRRELTGELTRERSPFHEQILFLALALIVAGVGFLKPNISTCVGALYDDGDKRRDPGFTIYYMGINIGAAAAAIAVPILAANYGWSVGFGAAAIGMLLGLITFVIGQDWLEGRADPPADVPQDRAVAGPLTWPHLTYLAGLAFTIVSYGLLQVAQLMSTAMHFVFAIVSAIVLIYMLTRLERVARDRMISLFILIITSILFWTLFDQGPSSLNFFAGQHVTNEIGGWEFPAAVLQAANPIFIIIFAIPVAALWTFLGNRDRDPNVFIKFAIGLVQIGAGFFVLNFGITTAAADPEGALRISVVFILLMYLLHTTGELFLSPVGLSAVTKLSVANLVGFMMGYWFFAVSYANVIAAAVARATQVPEGASSAESLALYNAVYFQLGAAAVALGVLLMVLTPWLKRFLHGVK